MTRGQPLPSPRAFTLAARVVSLLLAVASAAGPAHGAVAKLFDEPEHGGKVSGKAGDGGSGPAPIVLLYSERPPYNSRTPDGKLSGIVGTPVTQAFAKAGLRFELHEASLQRQLEALKRNTPRVCVSGLYKTAEREQFARYTKPVSQDQAMVGLANTSFAPTTSNGTATLTVHGLLTNPEVTVLLRDAVNYGPFLEGEFATMKARRATTDGQFAQMVKMIYAGRAQLTFFPLEEAQYYAKVAGYSAQQFKLLSFADMPAGEKRYILCSRQVEAAVVEKLNAGLAGG